MKCSKWHHIDISTKCTVVVEGGYALTGRILKRSDLQEEIDNQVEDDRHEEEEFLQLRLTCPFCAPDIVYYPEDTIVVINVNQILFIGPSYDCPSNNM